MTAQEWRALLRGLCCAVLLLTAPFFLVRLLWHVYALSWWSVPDAVVLYMAAAEGLPWLTRLIAGADWGEP